MKIGILSNQLDAYPTQRLLEECENLNVEGLFIKTPLVRLRLRKDSNITFDAQYLGHSLGSLNVVIPRIGSSMTLIGELILRHLEAMGIPMTTSADGIHIARDKFSSLQRLGRNRLPIPETVLINSTFHSMDFLSIRNLPIVLKPRNLFHGIGCIKINELSLLKEIIEAIISYSAQNRRSIMIQEFIEQKKPYQDYRLFIVNNEVIAAMIRTANQPDEWRTNVARGGLVSKYSPTKKEVQLAVKGAEILGLKIAGVDIIHDKDENPLILEINSCPGWKGIEEATGKNVAGKIIQFALEIAKKNE
jgi:ribosomal protein S6--L-glutamate ligase